jgi:hypothetical protein
MNLQHGSFRAVGSGWIFFFLFIVCGGPEAPIVYIVLCRPSEDSLQGSAIPDGSLSKD